jgi:hypothetical protein
VTGKGKIYRKRKHGSVLQELVEIQLDSVLG